MTDEKLEKAQKINMNASEKLKALRVDYLLGRTDESQGSAVQKNDIADNDDKCLLIRNINKLNPDELKQLMDMAEFFLKKNEEKNKPPILNQR